MKKRLISLMMAAVMAGSLAGCGGGAGADTTAPGTASGAESGTTEGTQTGTQAPETLPGAAARGSHTCCLRFWDVMRSRISGNQWLTGCLQNFGNGLARRKMERI